MSCYLLSASHNPFPKLCPYSTIKASMILSTGLIVFIVMLLLNICCHCCGFPPRRQNWQVNNTTAMTTDDNSRLDSKVLSSLPIFVHSSTAQEGKLECAVCLGEFKDGDKCRLLPRCNHSFHTDCVDAWFGSHSSCPLCRDTVKSDNPEAAV